jgi:excisionase family DNA binding protein
MAAARPKTATPTDFRLLKVEEVADLIGVSRRTVYALIQAGFLETVNVGSAARPRLRVTPAEMDRFIAERTARVS